MAIGGAVKSERVAHAYRNADNSRLMSAILEISYEIKSNHIITKNGVSTARPLIAQRIEKFCFAQNADFAIGNSACDCHSAIFSAIGSDGARIISNINILLGKTLSNRSRSGPSSLFEISPNEICGFQRKISKQYTSAQDNLIYHAKPRK